MTKSPRKNVPDVEIELGAACMPSELASDRATAPGETKKYQFKAVVQSCIETKKYQFKAVLKLKSTSSKLYWN